MNCSELLSVALSLDPGLDPVDRIVQITEYANLQTYENQGIEPTEVRIRTGERTASITAIP